MIASMSINFEALDITPTKDNGQSGETLKNPSLHWSQPMERRASPPGPREGCFS
jgi:hypothetical protein